MADSEDLHAKVAALEARLRQVEDEREIRELLSQYGYTADTCRDDDYLDLWTDDGVMNLGSDVYKKLLRYEGRAAIKEFITDPKAHHNPEKYGKRMHVQGNNMQCRINGDEAVATSYSIVLLQVGDKVTLTGAGNNTWLLRRERGRWRIRERRRRAIGTKEYLENVGG